MEVYLLLKKKLLGMRIQIAIKKLTSVVAYCCDYHIYW